MLATLQESVELHEMMRAPGVVMLEKVNRAVGTRARLSAEVLFTEAGVPFERQIGSGKPAQPLVEIDGREGRLSC